MAMFWIILGVIAWVALAFWPASIAKRKGYSFWLFFLLSVFVSWLVTLIVAALLSEKNQTKEDVSDDAAAEAALDAEEHHAEKEQS